jgi:hypothetical protein
MIVYFMCFGKLPYSNAEEINEEKEDLDKLREEITTWAGFDDERRVRADLPDRLYKFLKRLLALHAVDRPSTEEILQGIKAGSNLDDMDDAHPPSILDDLRHRISAVESPSPTPRRMSSRPGTLGNHLSIPKSRPGPGPSNLRPPSPEKPHRPPSPTKAAAPQNGSTASLQNSTAVIRARKVEVETVSSPSGHSSPPPRLALPPPPTTLSWVLEFISSPSTSIALKVMFFFVKYLTVTGPCSPFASNSYIAYPLMIMALFDFVTFENERQGVGRSFVLLAVHLLFVLIAFRAGALCPRKGLVWDEI